MTRDHLPRQGLLIAVCGFSLLSCGDAVIKSMAGEWPGTAVAALRFSLGACGLGVILWLRQGRAGFHVPRMWVQAGRGLGLAVASLLFFLSLFIMPLAEATAIQFISPAIIALLSALFLGERIRPASWIAMLLATAGVAIVLRPNLVELGWAALMPVAAAFAMSVFVLLNRVSATDVPPLAAQFWAAAWATPVQLLAAVAGSLSGLDTLAIHAPHWSVIARCALVALSASCAHFLVYKATTKASAAAIAPASYVQIIVALAIGVALFGDLPDAMAMAGTTCIIVAGLLLWFSAPKGGTTPLPARQAR